MIEKLNQRDKRALQILGVFVVALAVLLPGTKWLGHWQAVRKSLAAERAKLEIINVGEAKQAGLLSKVPAFEMPQKQEKQKYLFREKFNEQLKKAGVKSEPIRVLPTLKSRQKGGYKLLRLQYRGKCKFGQMLDLLANLNENPYLVGIEELKIRCDEKKRQEIELNLTVSTFVR